MKIPTLLIFLKGNSDSKANMPGCANYDRNYGGCLLAQTAKELFALLSCKKIELSCFIENSKSCTYFEKAVLPVAYQNGYGDKMTDLYNKQTGAKIRVRNKPKVRKCDCGVVLKSRQRLCSKCKIKKRRETYRNEKKRQRG